MDYQSEQPSRGDVWAIVARQHGVITRAQLLALGFHAQAIKHRIGRGRLHPVQRGVYAVGRPGVSRYGLWMAAVLSCGPEAALSHECAAALLQIREAQAGPIEVSVPAHVARRRPGIVVHRRAGLGVESLTEHRAIPVTTAVQTLVDLATRLARDDLEAAINETDKCGLATPEILRSALDELSGRPGLAILREVLDRRTFRLTDSWLERRFLPLARGAGLPPPETRRFVNGFRVDFYWPDLGLIVETDGLRYHRTPAEQASDRRRDQAHAAAGLTPLRFTHAQIRFEPGHVRATLAAVARRLKPGDPRR